MPGNLRRWRRSSWASKSASSATCEHDSSTWLTPPTGRPRVPVRLRHRQPGQSAGRPPAQYRPPGHPWVLREVEPRLFQCFAGPARDLLAHLTVEALPHPELTLEPRSPHRRAAGRIDVVAVADGQLEAPAPEVDAQGRPFAYVDAGSLPNEAEPGLLWTVEHPNGRPERVLERRHHLRAVGRIAEGGGGQRHDDVGTGPARALGARIWPPLWTPSLFPRRSGPSPLPRGPS